MTRIVSTLDRRKLRPFELGARLAVELAFPPGVEDDEKRGRTHRVLCGQYLRKKALEDPAWAECEQSIKPYYLLSDTKTDRRDMNTLESVIDRRLTAARFALAQIKDHIPLLSSVPLPYELSPPSMTRFVNFAGEHIKMDKANFRKRIWNPSKPVIHLSMALALALIKLGLEKNKGKKSPLSYSSIGETFFDPARMEMIILASQEMEDFVKNLKPIVNKEEIVYFRLL